MTFYFQVSVVSAIVTNIVSHSTAFKKKKICSLICRQVSTTQPPVHSLSSQQDGGEN